MSSITIAITFANRRSEPEFIESIHAWDVDSVMENPSGYEDTKREAIESWGDDLLRWVTAEVDVPDVEIRKALLGELTTLRSSNPFLTTSSEGEVQ